MSAVDVAPCPAALTLLISSKMALLAAGVLHLPKGKQPSADISWPSRVLPGGMSLPGKCLTPCRGDACISRMFQNSDPMQAPKIREDKNNFK